MRKKGNHPPASKRAMARSVQLLRHDSYNVQKIVADPGEGPPPRFLLIFLKIEKNAKNYERAKKLFKERAPPLPQGLDPPLKL